MLPLVFCSHLFCIDEDCSSGWLFYFQDQSETPPSKVSPCFSIYFESRSFKVCCFCKFQEETRSLSFHRVPREMSSFLSGGLPYWHGYKLHLTQVVKNSHSIEKYGVDEGDQIWMRFVKLMRLVITGQVHSKENGSPRVQSIYAPSKKLHLNEEDTPENDAITQTTSAAQKGLTFVWTLPLALFNSVDRRWRWVCFGFDGWTKIHGISSFE